MNRLAMHVILSALLVLGLAAAPQAYASSSCDLSVAEPAANQGRAYYQWWWERQWKCLFADPAYYRRYFYGKDGKIKDPEFHDWMLNYITDYMTDLSCEEYNC